MARQRAQTRQRYRTGANPYQAVLPKLDLEAAMIEASQPNDLVPRRPEDAVAGNLGSRFLEELSRRLAHGTYEPTPAYGVTVQKANLTTRRASILNFPDRVVYTALVGALRSDIDKMLAEESIVFWPRGRPSPPRWDDFKHSMLTDGSCSVATSDITEFYASIDHQHLGGLVVRATGSQELADATVAFLSRILKSDRGLPQGLPPSDALSTLYLSDLDSGLIQSGFRHARHGDDIRLAASDYPSARRAVMRLEDELRSLRLYMNGEKTKIYTRDEYAEWLSAYDRQVDDARERSVEVELDQIASDEALLENAIGRERFAELHLDSIYGRGEILREVIAELRDTIDPEAQTVAEELFLGIFDRRPGQPGSVGRVVFDRCLKKALVTLSASKSDVALGHMGELLIESPHNVSLCCSYLESMKRFPRRVAREIERAIGTCMTEAEYVWLIRTLAKVSSSVSAPLVQELRQTMDKPHNQWMAAVEVAKLLGDRGELRREDLTSLWESCPAAFRADLVVAAVRMERHQSWAKAWVGGTKSDRILSEVAKRKRGG